MKVAFIGYGNVGALLADHLQRLGHEVTLAAKDPASDNVRKALERNPALKVAEPVAAVSAAGSSPRRSRQTKPPLPPWRRRLPARCWSTAPTRLAPACAMAWAASGLAAR